MALSVANIAMNGSQSRDASTVYCALKKGKKEKNMATQGRDPSPLLGAPKACSSWEQERPRFAREGGQGRGRGTKRGSASRAWHSSGLQASGKSRFLFGCILE